MKRSVLSTSLALALATLAGACAAPAGSSDPVLRVIAFNDFHGNLEPGQLSLTLADPRSAGATLRVAAGGAAALGGLVKELRAGAAHSVVVSSGDLVGAAPLVSSLFRHESTIEVMNALGVDIATVGNHEFDAGAAELQRLIRGGCGVNRPQDAGQSCATGPNYGGSKFAWTVANVHGQDGKPLMATAWVRDVAGIPVGFIGAVTRTTPGIVVPSGVAGLRFEDEARAINREVAALESRGIKAIVVTIHEGAENGGARPGDWNGLECPNLRDRLAEIAPKLSPQVDLIVSGHTHQGYNCVLGGRHVMQAVSYGRGVSVADLPLDRATGDVVAARVVARNLPAVHERTDPIAREALAASLPPAFGEALRRSRPLAALANQVERYSQAAAPRANRVIGRIQGGFDRRGEADSSAGRLIADAQFRATRAPERGGAQFALMNPGGIRSDLPCRGAAPPCDVTYGDAFTMQPFGNSLVVMTLSGAELKRLLEQQQKPGRDTPLFLEPSEGIAYRWLAAQPFGQRVQDLQVQGRPVQDGDTVRFTVNSYLAEGGDGFSLLKQGRERLGGAQDLDALADHLATAPAPIRQPRIVIQR